ncbi:MAG: helix-turn-helix domain-containing protein [Cyclobacteriaceae bacterium]
MRSYRLKRAAQLIEDQFGNVSEIADEVGFNSLTYFTRSFKQYYGRTPTEFLQEKR